MEKILPLEYITEHPPVEALFDVGAWFEKEEMTLTVGEATGRPNPDTILRSNLVAYLLGNGWTIKSTGEARQGGSWSATVKTTSSGGSSSQSDSNNSTHSDAHSSSKASSSQSTESSARAASLVADDGTSSKVTGSANGKSESSGTSRSTGGGSAHASSSSSSDESGTTTMDGSPYWWASRSVTLTRVRMKSENVLKDMIAQFTLAFNRGAKINNERYDELVNLYAILLSRTEDEIGGWALDTDAFKPLVDEILKSCREALENFRGGVEEIPDNWMQSRIDEINRKFDALLEKARSDLITQGLYNGTVWPSTESGIERDRQFALNGLKDDMVMTKIDAYGKIATLTAEIGGKVVDAASRLLQLQADGLKPTEMRNQVFKWMLDFMERRDDEYPGLDAVVQAASALGHADGGFGG